MDELNIFSFLLALLTVSATLLGICVPAISIIYKFLISKEIKLEEDEENVFRRGIWFIIIAAIAFFLAIFLVILLIYDIGFIWIPILSFVIGCLFLLITICIIGGVRFYLWIPTKKEPTERVGEKSSK